MLELSRGDPLSLSVSDPPAVDSSRDQTRSRPSPPLRNSFVYIQDARDIAKVAAGGARRPLAPFSAQHVAHVGRARRNAEESAQPGGRRECAEVNHAATGGALPVRGASELARRPHRDRFERLGDAPGPSDGAVALEREGRSTRPVRPRPTDSAASRGATKPRLVVRRDSTLPRKLSRKPHRFRCDSAHQTQPTYRPPLISSPGRIRTRKPRKSRGLIAARPIPTRRCCSQRFRR